MISVKEIEALKCHQRKTKDKSVYAKIACILMMSNGISAEDVSIFLAISISSAYRYFRSYSAVGLDDFLLTDYKGYWGQLSSVEIKILRAELKRNTCTHVRSTSIYTDAKSVAAWIKDTFAVDYTPQGTVDLLNRIGFTYKKTKEVPCERDPEKREKFVKEATEIFENLDEKTVVYYADGVHPTHNSRSTYGWIEKGTEFEQPTVSGRDRVNINGLLNAKDVIDVITLDCERINAQSTKELYQMALEKHPEAEKILVLRTKYEYISFPITRSITRTKS
jgi:transposase